MTKKSGIWGRLKSFSRQNLSEMLIVTSLVVGFIDLSLLSSFTKKIHLTLFNLAAISPLNLYLIYLLYLYFLKQRLNKPILRPSYLIIPIFIRSLVSSQFLDVIPRWDGSHYYQALINSIETFNLTFGSFIDNFNWFGHPTMGFAFLTSLGLLLNPTNLFILNLTNSLLSIITILCFHRIIVKLFGDKNRLENVLISTAFALNPLFVGISTTYGPDFGSLVLFVITIAAFLSEKLILTAFFGTLFVFTKETGSYLYFIFVIAYFFLSYPSLTNKRHIDKKKLLSLFLPMFFLFLYYMTRNFKLWSPDGVSVFTWEDGCRFCFGLKRYNVVLNLSVIFLLNFNWLLSLVIVIHNLKNLFSRKQEVRSKFSFSMTVLESVKWSFTGFVAFFIFFLVYISPRYMVLGTPLLIIISYSSLRGLVSSPVYRRLCLIAICILYFIQIYFTIDPVSIKIFGTYQFGKHKLLTIGTEYLGDGAIYNTQYIYVQRILDKFIDKYQIDGNSTVFVDPYAWGTFQTGWGHFALKQPNILYDTKSFESLPSKMYYLSFPLMKYGENDELKIQKSYTPPIIDPNWLLSMFKNYYQITVEEKIEIDGYSVNTYQLEKLPDEK